MVVLKLILSFALSLPAYAVYKVLRVVYRELTSPIRRLPGPPSRSGHWLQGDLGSTLEDSDRWADLYGPTMQCRGALRASHRFILTRLYTMDSKAINHFLMNSDIYQKPEATRYTLSQLIGPGVLVVEGDIHKKQRKIMNPAFGPAQLRELTGIFVEKSIQLRDIWASQIAQEGRIAPVEVMSWLNKATLDMIGLAGFGYSFNALSAERKTPDELEDAFSIVGRAGSMRNPIHILQTWFPLFRFIPTAFGKLIKSSQSTMMRIGTELLKERKKDIAESWMEKGRSRDLLSLLVRANAAKDVSASQQLSDEDVLAQVPTFLVAGHESTSTAMTWALFALTQNKAAQTRLRDELLAVSNDNPTMDDLNALPYLDCVVRETLRVYAPVPRTSRIAKRDDVVPLDTPFTDIDGLLHETLTITNGQKITIPIDAMNRSRAIWGPDALEFIPERWESATPIFTNIPGVWAHMLTFLGGPRACIGYRFALVEMKTLLFTLVRAFEFELAVPASDVGQKCMIVQGPVLRSNPEGGNEMPLLIKSFVRQ
ncbi:cytochrome P450 [Mycena rebaudengoi]|nr:cytochrome P450 [Mycena rebaudengoi]